MKTNYKMTTSFDIKMNYRSYGTALYAATDYIKRVCEIKKPKIEEQENVTIVSGTDKQGEHVFCKIEKTV